MQYHTLPYSIIHYRTVSYITVQYHTSPYSIIHYRTVSYITVQYHTSPYSIIHYRTVSYITVQYHTLPYSIIHYRHYHTLPTVSYITVQYHTSQYPNSQLANQNRSREYCHKVLRYQVTKVVFYWDQPFQSQPLWVDTVKVSQ